MPGRNWLEALALIFTISWAGSAWASGSAEQDIARTYPQWAQALWYGELIIGAFLALVGLVWHRMPGWLLLGGVGMSFGIAFAVHSGRSDLSHAVYVVVGVFGFAAACISRARQIRAAIRASQSARLAALQALQSPRESSA
ncbi:MAG: hypothetical protein M3460_04615 [Actinomycetota bacterium]|nr:hypothetical protein [Actinomycetota bacterium]